MALLIQNAETLIPLLRMVGIVCAVALVPLLILTIYLYTKLDIRTLRRFVKNNKPKVKYEPPPEEKPAVPTTKAVVEKIPQEVLKKLEALLGDGDINQTEGWHTTPIPATNWQKIQHEQSLQMQEDINKSPNSREGEISADVDIPQVQNNNTIKELQ